MFSNSQYSPLFKVETTATFYVQPGQKVIIEGVSVGGDLVVKLLKSSRDVSTQTTG